MLDSPVQTFVLLLIAIPALIICVKLGSSKGRPGLGWAMGLLLGWIGVIVMLCVSKTRERKVSEAIEAEAIAREAAGRLTGRE